MTDIKVLDRVQYGRHKGYITRIDGRMALFENGYIDFWIRLSEIKKIGGTIAMAGIKRTKHDDIFSKLVRERADFHCEYCGKDYRDRPQGLHCSHLQGRRSRSTRWHPHNAFAHCYSCHQYLGANPAEYSLWAQNEMGEDLVWEIVRKSKQPMKIKPAEMEQLYFHMKSQYQEMLQKRLYGHVGRLEFTVPVWYE